MGVKTLYEYFYKLAYGAKGIVEHKKYVDNLDVADAEIKANKDARHIQGTDQGLDTGGDNAVVVANVKDAVNKKHTQGTDYSNIVICADYDHPDDAITAIASANKTLLVTEAETCDINFTVPANVTVRFERGGKWTINNGITVTFNGQIDAGLWQIFEYVGTGTLAGLPLVEKKYPQWWINGGAGTSGDPWTSATGTAGIKEAISDGDCIVFLMPGYYSITTGIELKKGTHLVGSNNVTTILKIGNGIIGITYNGTVEPAASYIVLSSFQLQPVSTTPSYGIYLNYAHQWRLDHIVMQDWKNAQPFRIYHSWSGKVEYCLFLSCTQSVTLADGDNNFILFDHCNFNGGSDVGCNIEQLATNIIFHNCGFESNTAYGMRIKGDINNIKIDGCYFESNGTIDLLINPTATSTVRSVEVKNSYFRSTDGNTAVIDIQGKTNHFYITNNLFVAAGTTSYVVRVQNADNTDIWQGFNVSSGTFTNGYDTEVDSLEMGDNKLSIFSATTSAELAGVINDKTGTGKLVFADTPTFTGQNIYSTQTEITAYSGGGQANAVLITKDIAEISVCAVAGDSVKLPVEHIGKQITIINHGAAAANVFPSVGQIINEQASNVALSLPINATMFCTGYETYRWECVVVNRP